MITDEKEIEKKVSGYAIYAPQYKERTIVNNLPEFYPSLPDDRFDIIYCRSAVGLWWENAVR
jgi:modification methylase munI